MADPEEQYRAMKEIADSGESLLAIYHSHPWGPAYPSKRDVNMAFYPESFYLIISLHKTAPSARCFCIQGGIITEGNLKILDDVPEQDE